MNIAFFFLAGALAGAVGFGFLRRLGLDDFEAWAGGRMAGLVMVALPAWWLGVLGLHRWRAAGTAVLLVLGAVGLVSLWRRRASWREILRAEAIYLVTAALVIFIRLDHPNISHQEKPMDLGIFASLLRAEGFPPPDMWLSGELLPYYYWGALVWIVPIAVSSLPLDFAYNLVVGMAAASVAALLWAAGRRIGGTHRSGLLVAFFGLLAGTPDGLRQLLNGRGLAEIDAWRSSRQILDTITEFPLFTFWHGDLHPHLLSMPLACLAILVALEAGRRGPGWIHTVTLAVLFGVCWSANPWSMPPTLASIVLLLLADDSRWYWPVGEGRTRWLAAGTVAIGGWLVTAPFHLAFTPFFDGIGLVSAWTSPGDLLLYGGCLLVPSILASIGLMRREVGGEEGSAQAVLLATGAAVLVLAAATGRPTLIILTAVTALFVAGVLRPGAADGRAALALAALGTFLFLVPEVVFVVDSYGADLHRMNTVFKSYIQGWIFLAVALPTILRLVSRSRARRGILVALMVAAGLPHLLGMGVRQFGPGGRGIDGLAWMSPGDRAIVEALRTQPPGAVLIEAVGGAYTEYGRLSAASGVPAYLGWANHELVWRGSEIAEETDRRKDLVQRLYSSGDIGEVRRLAREAGATLIAVGSLERRDFPAGSLAAVEAAGDVLVDRNGALLVAVGGANQPLSPR